jgi:tRNA dimethylallyltransferase
MPAESGREHTPPLALVGPTATGKTRAAVALARDLEADIVSVDSMTVYRGMDVGTAKPTSAEREAVAHHLLDLVEPEEAFSVARYQRLARQALASIAARGRRPLLVGGSGLYFRSAVDELRFPATDPAAREQLDAEARILGADSLHRRLASFDPAAAAKIEPRNVRRTVRALEVAAVTGRPFSDFGTAWERYPPERVRAAGVEMPAEAAVRAIERRVRSMIDGGLVDEVRSLIARGLGGWLTASQAIGYAEVARHLDGELTLEEAIRGTVRRTRSLARRQLAWFKRDPRIRWFVADDRGAVAIVDELRGYLRG